MRTIRTWHVAAASLFLAACTAVLDTERAETTSASALPIWSGDAGTGPVVWMTSGAQTGSGVALNNNWVLTALHNVNATPWTAAKAQVGGVPPEYSATHAVAITNSAWPHGSGSATGTAAYDLALLRFTDMPIGGSTTDYKTNIFQRNAALPGTTTDQIVALGQVDCWGYGLGGPGVASGMLRHALLDVKHDDVTVITTGYGNNPIHMTAPANMWASRTTHSS